MEAKTVTEKRVEELQAKGVICEAHGTWIAYCASNKERNTEDKK